MYGIHKKYPIATKLHAMEKEFEALGIAVDFRKRYSGLLPAVEKVDEAFNELTASLIALIERDAYPTYVVSSGVKPINLIFETIKDRSISSYVAAKIEQFETRHALVFKVTPDLIYLETDKTKFFLDSVAGALKKIVESPKENVA